MRHFFNILLCIFVFAFVYPNRAGAVGLDINKEITNTPCASKIFAEALHDNSDSISEDVPEHIARAWAKNIMQSADVLNQVLECPEIKDIPDNQTISFNPVEYKFPNGRTLTINYTSQPKNLRQHILLANKRSLPNNIPNPALDNPEDFGKYMNTEPAWYGILVVQHDSLNEFVGPNKNNTLSLKYLNDHIDDIYPHGYRCLSKSALAPDYDIINISTHKTVDISNSDPDVATFCSGNAYSNDSNDYYVAGDVDLSWIKYAEIAADILLTVATYGGYAVVEGGLKYSQATRKVIQIQRTLKDLRKSSQVKNYAKTISKIASHTDDITKIKKNAKTLKSLTKNLENAKKANNLKEVAEIEQKISNISKEISKIKDVNVTIDILQDGTKTAETLTKLENNIDKLKETEKILLKDKQVQIYAESWKEADKLLKYRSKLKALGRPQTGNILARSLKALKASSSGTKQLKNAGKVARASMSSRSAKVLDWLFESTLRNGSRLAHIGRDLGATGMALKLILDFYDDTSPISKEFSNGIEFKPLCLLSADEIPGQENVVNYGMWLMWEGDSSTPEDDDAAYLQAMDFADKFATDLIETQALCGTHCNVDIFVVRPFIRLDETNPDNPHGEMYYLFMNDKPWSTSEQFDNNIKDKEAWEQEQHIQIENDYIKKYGKLPQLETPMQSDDNISETESDDYVSNENIMK